jgi:hypothetical protein
MLPVSEAIVNHAFRAICEVRIGLLPRCPQFAGTLDLGVPEQPPAVSGIDVALVRDGQIAELHTLLTARG